MRTVLVACAAVVLLAGCTHRQTFTTSQGATTVESNGASKSVTITTKEGTTTISANVDLAKLGLPVYPGATQNQGGISGTTAQSSGEVVALSTSDSFDKVYAWYRAHMPAGSEGMHMSSPTGSIATFQIGKDGDKEQRSVMITGEKDKTSILLSHNLKH